MLSRSGLTGKVLKFLWLLSITALKSSVKLTSGGAAELGRISNMLAEPIRRSMFICRCSANELKNLIRSSCHDACRSSQDSSTLENCVGSSITLRRMSPGCGFPRSLEGSRDDQSHSLPWRFPVRDVQWRLKEILTEAHIHPSY